MFKVRLADVFIRTFPKPWISNRIQPVPTQVLGVTVSRLKTVDAVLNLIIHLQQEYKSYYIALHSSATYPILRTQRLSRTCDLSAHFITCKIRYFEKLPTCTVWHTCVCSYTHTHTHTNSSLVLGQYSESRYNPSSPYQAWQSLRFRVRRADSFASTFNLSQQRIQNI